MIGETYGDLTIARIKAAEAENTSDLNSEADFGVGHRKIHMNSRYMESDSDENEKENSPISHSHTLEMPTLKKRCENPEGGSENAVLRNDVPISNSQNCFENGSASTSSEASASICISKTNPNNTRLNENLDNQSKDKQFKRQVLRNLFILNFKLDQLAEDIARIQSRKVEEEIHVQSIFSEFNFPLSTNEELQHIENALDNEEKYKQVLLELSRIGGSTHKTMVKRLMDKVLANQLAMTFSWVGFKRKENFSVLHLANVLVDAVMGVHTKVTRADVECCIKQWLVKAKERSEKEIK